MKISSQLWPIRFKLRHLARISVCTHEHERPFSLSIRLIRAAITIICRTNGPRDWLQSLNLQTDNWLSIWVSSLSTRRVLYRYQQLEGTLCGITRRIQTFFSIFGSAAQLSVRSMVLGKKTRWEISETKPCWEGSFDQLYFIVEMGCCFRLLSLNCFDSNALELEKLSCCCRSLSHLSSNTTPPPPPPLLSPFWSIVDRFANAAMQVCLYHAKLLLVKRTGIYVKDICGDDRPTDRLTVTTIVWRRNEMPWERYHSKRRETKSIHPTWPGGHVSIRSIRAPIVLIWSDGRQAGRLACLPALHLVTCCGHVYFVFSIIN